MQSCPNRLQSAHQYTVDIDYLNPTFKICMPCQVSVVGLVVSWGDLLKAKLHSIYLELQPEGSRRGSQNSAAGLGSIFHNLELAWKKLFLLSISI